MKQQLVTAGFEVTLFETGQQILDYLEDNTPDLILMDIIMPDIDGLTILHELKSNHGLHKVPVIILSNLSGEAILEQTKLIGEYDYLVKSDVSLEDIVDKVAKNLKV